ncbi:hypothetical protein BDN71DRAFT_1261727 [Pleurotus eryngii]|uniref:Uncharacterized protein n=1 Tax=Pleurotus eryngii TaxID=5323 RepID=A0A9P6A6R4_PLEER|nr:hypothetical protein BDN71DRAFT_1261727 [Pleurotus eryngii]
MCFPCRRPPESLRISLALVGIHASEVVDAENACSESRRRNISGVARGDGDERTFNVAGNGHKASPPCWTTIQHGPGSLVIGLCRFPKKLDPVPSPSLCTIRDEPTHHVGSTPAGSSSAAGGWWRVRYLEFLHLQSVLPDGALQDVFACNSTEYRIFQIVVIEVNISNSHAVNRHCILYGPFIDDIGSVSRPLLSFDLRVEYVAM